MTLELKLLLWSTALALIQMLIALVAAIAQVGFFAARWQPRKSPGF